MPKNNEARREASGSASAEKQRKQLTLEKKQVYAKDKLGSGKQGSTLKKRLYLKDHMESILRQYRQQQPNEERSEAAGGSWQLQTAKARFSEVFRLARASGPQLITRQGKEAVVVLSVEQFDQLVARARQPASLVQFFAESPLAGIDLNLKRSKDKGRKIDL